MKEEQEGAVLAWRTQFDINPNELERFLLTQKHFTSLSISYDDTSKPLFSMSAFNTEYQIPVVSEVDITAHFWFAKTKMEQGLRVCYEGQVHPKVADLPKVVATVYFQLVTELRPQVEEAMREGEIDSCDIIPDPVTELPQFRIRYQNEEYIIPVVKELHQQIVFVDPTTDTTIVLYESQKPSKIIQMVIPQGE